jgi:galactokinase/mevalonate kinase-like predicted kinase
MTEPARGKAHARAALAGNPSDGYGGAVLAVTLGGQRAEVTARAASQLEISPPSELVAATVARFAHEYRSRASSTVLQWTTSIPRGVGLGGSSAIVISTLRALSVLYDAELEATELAELALAIELHELQIAAGLQDRVAQAFGGLMFMDFDPAAGPDRYQRLDLALVPPLVVAWRVDAAGDSGAVHGPLRDRHAQGEAAVVRAMSELASLARGARDALLTGDVAEFGRCVDHSFDVRQQILALDPRHIEMISCARACGASANYAGSGGAIVAVCAPDSRRRVARELQQLGCDTLLI